MKTSLRKVGEVIVLDLSGSLLTGVSNRTFSESVQKLFDEGEKKILINLKHVGRIDSGGLGVLMGRKKVAAEKNADIKLLNPRGLVNDVFIMVHLHKVFEIFKDEKEAIASF